MFQDPCRSTALSQNTKGICSILLSTWQWELQHNAQLYVKKSFERIFSSDKEQNIGSYCLDPLNYTAMLYFVRVWRHITFVNLFDHQVSKSRVWSVRKSQSQKIHPEIIRCFWFGSLSPFKVVCVMSHKQITAFPLWSNSDGCWLGLIHLMKKYKLFKLL